MKTHENRLISWRFFMVAAGPDLKPDIVKDAVRGTVPPRGTESQQYSILFCLGISIGYTLNDLIAFFLRYKPEIKYICFRFFFR
jgi:hypothetical protein